jgi:hypothetical protein
MHDFFVSTYDKRLGKEYTKAQKPKKLKWIENKRKSKDPGFTPPARATCKKIFVLGDQIGIKSTICKLFAFTKLHKWPKNFFKSMCKFRHKNRKD